MPGLVSEEFDYSDDFASSVANDIGGSLFSPSSVLEPAKTLNEPETLDLSEPASVEAVEKPEAKTPAEPAVALDHPNIVPGQNSESKPMPKSWRKEMEPHWSKLPPEVHEYVHTREAQVMRGIQQYQEGANSWNSLIQPYAPIFQSQPDVQPVALMQSLMNTHLQLLNPSAPPEKKQAIMARMLSDYGITLENFSPPTVDPRISQLEQQIHQLVSHQQQTQRAAYESGVSEQTRQVEAFAQDPKNQYFPEVANDILRFIQTGAATDLASAYELACYANPAVRAKMLAPQASQANPGSAPRAKNGQFVNLDGSEVPNARPRAKSIDATIDGIVSSHFKSTH